MFNRVFGVSLLLAATSFAAACSDSGSGTDPVPPAAPTALTAEVLTGGAHLTWKDNSTDETQFMVMRMEVGGAGGAGAYAAVATPTFNTTQYHDAPLTAGKTYMFMVMAMNDAGESDPSNEVMIAMP